ncbi:hypothetical protein AMTRI_Chr03g43940 [Amborella trichopoda]
METPNGKQDGNGDAAVTEARPAVLKRTEYDAVRSNVAVFFWLGAIHCNAFLVLTAFALFPSWRSLLILGLLILLMLIPLDDKSKLGQDIARFVCKYACGYFPVTLHVEDMKAFSPNRAYVFAVEPHSVLPIAIVSLCNFTGFMPLPKIKALASSAIFYTPILRHIWTWMGLVAATKKNFVSYLRDGYSCIVIPGGAREIMYMEKGSEVAYLKARTGFVRVAMDMGSPLVPVFCFGQSDIYSWWKGKGDLYVRVTKALRFTPLVFWGRFGPIPYRRPMHVVVGSPIEVNRNHQPTKEEVAEVHQKYTEALRELFERHKAEAGYAEYQLRIL